MTGVSILRYPFAKQAQMDNVLCKNHGGTMENLNRNPFGDFLVVGGTLDGQGKKIETLRIQSSDGLNFGIPVRATRKEVVDALKENFVFLVSPELNSQTHRAARVKMIIVNGRPFIRTDGKKLPADFIEGVTVH
jgi:hypothetical protein